jgi:hypothetical protein
VVQIRNNLMQAGGFSTVTIPALKAYDGESVVTRMTKKVCQTCMMKECCTATISSTYVCHMQIDE